MVDIGWMSENCGDASQRVQTFSIRWVSSGELMSGLSTVVKNNGLHTWNLLSVHLQCPYTKKKMINL